MDLSSGGKGIRLKQLKNFENENCCLGESFDFNENKQSSMKERELKDEKDHHGKIR